MLEKAMTGFNATIFAYGQTGSGKSFSMNGAAGPELEGIIPRMNKDLFQRIESDKTARPTRKCVTAGRQQPVSTCPSPPPPPTRWPAPTNPSPHP
jgi:hypothetical protein